MKVERDLPDYGRLENRYVDVYHDWKSNPNPDTTSYLLKRVSNDIEKGIAAHVGRSNPLIRSRAKKIALGAIRSYDPTQAQLSTHIINQLQGLKRVARQQSQILSVPERVSLDQGAMVRARSELEERLGREPSIAELADYTGLSHKRLSYIQNFKGPIAFGSLTVKGHDDEEASYMPTISRDTAKHWQEFVYFDLDPMNQRIMEMTLGMHGQKKLSNAQVARQLGISPGAVSQRKAKIQQLLDQEEELSPFYYK